MSMNQPSYIRVRCNNTRLNFEIDFPSWLSAMVTFEYWNNDDAWSSMSYEHYSFGHIPIPTAPVTYLNCTGEAYDPERILEVLRVINSKP